MEMPAIANTLMNGKKYGMSKPLETSDSYFAHFDVGYPMADPIHLMPSTIFHDDDTDNGPWKW